jgi:hypothetical protein
MPRRREADRLGPFRSERSPRGRHLQDRRRRDWSARRESCHACARQSGHGRAGRSLGPRAVGWNRTSDRGRLRHDPRRRRARARCGACFRDVTAEHRAMERQQESQRQLLIAERMATVGTLAAASRSSGESSRQHPKRSNCVQQGVDPRRRGRPRYSRRSTRVTHRASPRWRGARVAKEPGRDPVMGGPSVAPRHRNSA